MEIKHNITSTAYTDANTQSCKRIFGLVNREQLISSNAKVKVKRITVQGYITKDLWKILIRFKTVDYKLMITLQVVCCLLKLRHVLSLKEIKCTKLSIYIAYKHASHDVAECAECYNVCSSKKYGN